MNDSIRLQDAKSMNHDDSMSLDDPRLCGSIAAHFFAAETLTADAAATDRSLTPPFLLRKPGAGAMPWTARRAALPASDSTIRGTGACSPRRTSPKAKRVIYLFMSGGPSQLDLFDYKPLLNG